MSYLIDTDWVADHLAGRPEATTLLETLLPHGIASSIISYGEVYEGIIWSLRYQQELQSAFLEFLRWCTVLPLDEAIMQRYAGIRGGLSRALLGPGLRRHVDGYVRNRPPHPGRYSRPGVHKYHGAAFAPPAAA